MDGCAYNTVLSKVPSDIWVRWKLGNPSSAGLPIYLLWWQRWHLTAQIGALGYNVLCIDTDIVFHSDPYPHLKVHT